MYEMLIIQLQSCKHLFVYLVWRSELFPASDKDRWWPRWQWDLYKSRENPQGARPSVQSDVVQLAQLLFFTPWLNLLLPKKARFGTAHRVALSYDAAAATAVVQCTTTSWTIERTSPIDRFFILIEAKVRRFVKIRHHPTRRSHYNAQWLGSLQ